MSIAQIAITGVQGCSAVALGAYGSHAGSFESDHSRSAFLTAAHYQLMHAAAQTGLIALQRALSSNSSGGGAVCPNASSAQLCRAAAAARVSVWLMVGGTALFSGTIYYRNTGGEREVGRLAPAGGFALMGGWLAMAAAALCLAI